MDPTLVSALDATYRVLGGAMTILEVDQFGRYPSDGDDVATFLAETKGDAYRPHLLHDVPETRTARWAKRWYRVRVDGTLVHHSDQFDSSD